MQAGLSHHNSKGCLLSFVCQLVCPISPCSAELCSRARQLGLAGEATAAAQILAERKQQASQQVTAAAGTSSAAAYQVAVATAEAAAVDAAVLSGAAATFAARCTEVAEALSSAAQTGSWTQFASAREEATVLQQDVQIAEAVISQRRHAASTAVSAALDSCMQGLSLKQGLPALMRERVHKRQQPSTPHSVALPCAECSDLAESPQNLSRPADNQPLQGAVMGTGLFQASADCRPPSHTPHIIHALTQPLDTVFLDTDKPDWEVAIAALSDAASPAEAGAAAARDKGLPATSSAAALATALTDARQLGLLQTVALALQALLAQAELQLQTQQAVVAKFDVPTQEHPQELCIAAWQHPTGMQQGMTHVMPCTTAAAAAGEGDHELPKEAAVSIRLPCWDSCSAETEAQVEQAQQLSNQLVAKILAGKHLCSFVPQFVCAVLAFFLYVISSCFHN